MSSSHVARRKAVTSRPLISRDNSLNLVRLVLATTVIVSHSFTLGGFGPEPRVAGRTLGLWAVIGFFCLSGYLIMGSRHRYRLGEFMVHRVARIYPGYIVSALVVILLLAPFAYALDHGSLAGYLGGHPTTPLTYLWGNAFLEMKAYDISGTLADVPYPAVWNGSLWSLHYEFLCYLVVAMLGLWGVAARSRTTVGVLFLVSVALHANQSTVSVYATQADLPLLLSVLPCFLGGSLLYLFRDSLHLSASGLVAAIAFCVAATWMAPTWGPQLSAPAILYVLLWLGATLPSPKIVKKHDVSYGMYIYGFPAQQMLALASADALGAPVYIVLSIMVTVPLAVASWMFVERPAMLRSRRPPMLVTPGRHAARTIARLA